MSATFTKLNPFLRAAILTLCAAMLFIGIKAYGNALHARDARDAQTMPYCKDASVLQRADGRCLPTGYVRP